MQETRPGGVQASPPLQEIICFSKKITKEGARCYFKIFELV